MSKREMNTATSKQKVLIALLEKMKEEDFDVIKISDLCKNASISQASFYNYFPQKTDILAYYIQLWAVEIYWKISIKHQQQGLKAIRDLFCHTAELCVSQSNLLTEIIALQVKIKKIVNKNPLTSADKLVNFPNLDGIESVMVQDLKDILSIYVKQAIDNQELPRASDFPTLITSLSAIFFSVPILFNQCSEEVIKEAFDNQLNLFMYGAVSPSLNESDEKKAIDNEE